MITNNEKENKTRQHHTYKVGDRVLMYNNQAQKYESIRNGPYTVLKVNTNGTLRIQRGPIEDTVNIRQLRPYYAEP